MVARQVSARKMLPMMEFAATVFVTFLVIIDPIGTLPLFVALTHRQRKDERRIEMSVKLAPSRSWATSMGFDLVAQPSLDKKQIREIATGRFVANAGVVMLLGHPASANAPGGGDRQPGRERHRRRS